MGVVDRIDGPSLGPVRCGRQGKIGVTAGLAKDGKFITHPTVMLARMRVIERPIAVNEGVPQGSSFIAGEEIVIRQLIDALL